MGGLVKDVFLARRLSDVRAKLSGRAPNGVQLAVRDLGLPEARARIVAALDVLDHTYDPPVDEDVSRLRALIEARVELLPAGFELGDEHREIPQAERERILGEFLDSPHGERWAGDEDAEDVVATAIEVGADRNHGGPLRWSPVVVEIFMTGRIVRKVIRESASNDRAGADAELPDLVSQVSAMPGFAAGYWVATSTDKGTALVVFDSEDGAQTLASIGTSTAPGAVSTANVEVGEVLAHA